MKTSRNAILALALAAAMPAAWAEPLQVSGSPVAQCFVERHADAIEASSGVEVSVSSVGSAKGLLDLVEGKVSVAAIAMPLTEAIESARRQAVLEGKGFTVPVGLHFHEVMPARGEERAVGFVTVGAPSSELQRVLMYLRSHEGRSLLATR